MNKVLILSAMALLLPIVPALACFPDDTDTEKGNVLFHTEQQGRTSTDFQFTRAPIPMSFCESGERSFVVVNGKCYDQDAITDYDTEEECEADEICNAYREDQRKQAEEPEPWMTCDAIGGCHPTPEPEPLSEPITDPNHGEIKGDEELEQDEEEHQEEEEQGEEESKETTAETS